jgi:hypothetical protein
MDHNLDALKQLRAHFPSHQISKLPKPTARQTDEVKANFKAGTRCKLCGAWHHPDVVHLDYVGHAALTDRLLDVDPTWSWEPVAVDSNGVPLIDKDGGLWIRLTVCGVTRLGYGDAQGKTGGNAMKERIGDALRNAGMRFGAALDLWHKGELHVEEEDTSPAPPPPPPQPMDASLVKEHVDAITATQSQDDLFKVFSKAYRAAHAVGDKDALEKFMKAKDGRKAELEPPAEDDVFGVNP